MGLHLLEEARHSRRVEVSGAANESDRPVVDDGLIREEKGFVEGVEVFRGLGVVGFEARGPVPLVVFLGYGAFAASAGDGEVVLPDGEDRRDFGYFREISG